MYASAAGDTHNSSDASGCLMVPEERACSTLNFIITNILLKEMFWINTIYMDDYRAMEPEIITLTDLHLKSQRSISVMCSSPCYIENHFTIVAHTYQQGLLFQIINITFTNSQISMWNVDLLFENVQFVNSVLTDWQPAKGSFGHLALYFLKNTLENHIFDESYRFGLILNKTFSATIVFTGSKLKKASLQIDVPHLLFRTKTTSYSSSFLNLSVPFYCAATFERVHFTSNNHGVAGMSLLNIVSNQLNLTFTECVVNNTSGGFSIEKQDSGLLGSMIRVLIQSCLFKNNIKEGSGAAVEFNVFLPNENKPDAVHYVEIRDSTFIENKAHRFALASAEGGAMSFLSRSTADHCHTLNINVDSSIFTDNQAANGGGALYMSDNCLKTIITNCSFEVTEKMFDSPKGVFIWSLSEITVNLSVFNRDVKQLSPSLLELEMLSDRAEILQLNINVQCHKWSALTLDSTFIEKQAKVINIRCTTCPASFYIPSDGHFSVSYWGNTTNVFVHGRTSQSKDLRCTPCPLGANCPGNDLISKPNFWGSNTGNVIAMYQCPADYCCATNCTGYDQCSGHRTGVLCGSCEENYSLSMLSSECIEAETCDDHWLWPSVICAVVLYVAWYTFKNDIFAIPSFIVKKLYKCCFSESEDSDIYYIDKGYFGIVTYFIQVQSVMRLSISFDSESKIDNFFNQIESYIGLALNFELTYFSNDTCSVKGLTTSYKMMFRLLFLLGIFISWNFIFLSLSLLKLVVTRTARNLDKLNKLKIKLISGLAEIIKYTYLGFTSIVFLSLTCTSVAGNTVWFYDGSVQCYSVWQTVMIIFCLVHILPYPLLIYLALKLLKDKKVSQKSFFVAIYFPSPVLLYWLVLYCKQNVIPRGGHGQPQNKELDVENAIYDGFTGGFRKSRKGTQFWEAVLALRRLLISATILISNSQIQLCVCLTLCLIFLIHHMERKPFLYHVSNKAETFSLCLLCGVAALNLFKAAEINPEGSQVEIIKFLQLLEGAFVVLLIIFIVCFETAFAMRSRMKKATQNKTCCIRLPCFRHTHDTAQQEPAEPGSSKSPSDGELQLETVVHDNAGAENEEQEKTPKEEIEQSFENGTKI